MITLHCSHQQAEPVILTTGETVACVCIGCLAPLPADHIERQEARALREAYEPDFDPFVEDLLEMMLQPVDAAGVMPLIIHTDDPGSVRVPPGQAPNGVLIMPDTASFRNDLRRKLDT